MNTHRHQHSKHIWQQHLNTAIQTTKPNISLNTQAYLVYTIDHYMTDSTLCNRKPLGLYCFEALSEHDHLKLREVGDRCLILSSIFPQYAAARNTQRAFYNQLGQSAYHMLAHQTPKSNNQQALFLELSIKFPIIVNTIREIRRA